MHWLNLEITRTQGPEYTSAEPAQQLAWFHLLLYCAQQENGGVIEGASEFTDRQWSRMIDVEGATLKSKCSLWSWTEDGGLVVWEYPAKQEQVVKAKREGGKRGGEAKAQNRSTATSTPSSTPSRTPTSSATSTPTRSPSTKEKEKEKEKEELKEEVPPISPKGELSREKIKRPAVGPEPEACAVILPGKPSAELLEAWREWQHYRQKRASAPFAKDRKPWTEQAARLSAKQIMQYATSHGDRIVCDRITKAIAAGWQGPNFDGLDGPTTYPRKMTYEQELEFHKPDPNSENGW